MWGIWVVFEMGGPELSCAVMSVYSFRRLQKAEAEEMSQGPKQPNYHFPDVFTKLIWKIR